MGFLEFSQELRWELLDSYLDQWPAFLKQLEKTAQSIRNRSSPHLSKRLRVRLPRPLSRELPLSPYSWEEAVGVSMLLQADGFKDETFVLCKALKQAGKFIFLSEKLVFIGYCSCLVGVRFARICWKCLLSRSGLLKLRWVSRALFMSIEQRTPSVLLEVMQRRCRSRRKLAQGITNSGVLPLHPFSTWERNYQIVK